jgi:hypothetical protein
LAESEDDESIVDSGSDLVVVVVVIIVVLVEMVELLGPLSKSLKDLVEISLW